MKNLTAGRIFCRCSVRMHCKGHLVPVGTDTSEKHKCPNCGKLCTVTVSLLKQKGKKKGVTFESVFKS